MCLLWVARGKNSDLRCGLHGAESLLKPGRTKQAGLTGEVNVHHTTDFIQGSEKPSQA